MLGRVNENQLTRSTWAAFPPMRQHLRGLEAALEAGVQGLRGGGQFDPMQGNGFSLYCLLSSFFV